MSIEDFLPLTLPALRVCWEFLLLVSSDSVCGSLRDPFLYPYIFFLDRDCFSVELLDGFDSGEDDDEEEDPEPEPEEDDDEEEEDIILVVCICQ